MLKRTLLLCALLAHALTSNSQVNLNLLSNYVYPPSRGECSDIWGYVDQAGNEYAIVGNNNGTSIVDVTNPANPSEVFYSAGPSSIWRDIKVWQNTAYITNEESGGMKIIDMSNLPGPITGADVYNFSGSTYPFSTAHDLYIDENGQGYILGANNNNGVGGAIILDLVSNPLVPTELGQYNDFYLHDAFVRGDTLWGGAINDGFFVVVDVSNPASTTTMATQFTPSTFTHNCWVSDDGNYVFTTDEVSGAFIGSYDVSDINNIVQLDQIQSSPGNGVIPHNTFVRGDYLVTSYYRDGVTVHDISDPANMVEVANYDTSPAMSGNGFNGLWGVYPYLPSGNIIGSDIEKGLFVWGGVFSPAAYLTGNITDIVTTNPINNAQVEILTTSNTDNSDALGDYAIGTGTGGTYSVTFTKLGYATETINNVVLTNGVTTVLDVEMQPLATFTLSGQVIDENSDPVIGAQVKISSTQFTTTVTTNGLGNFDVPSFLEGTYDVFIGEWGFHSFCALNENLLIAGNPYVYQIQSGYSDDFALDLGWSISGNPSTGDWERGIPNGTTLGGDQSNPGADSQGDCGEEAYVTGNGGGSAGDDDIDGGETVLTSPVFDLSSYVDPYVSFERWFFNDGGSGSPNDSMVVELTNGTTTVMLDFAVANDPNAGTWASKNFKVSDFLIPTSSMQLKVRAMDIPSGHISEAGLDMFRVVDSSGVGIETLADFNGISVYPSPFHEKLTINSSASVDHISIEVYEMTSGRKIDSRTFENAPVISFENNYAHGVYLIQVYGDDELLKTERVIKM